MRQKIFLTIVTALFAYIFLLLIQPCDSFADFVPFLELVLSRRIYVSAYDLFFVLSGLLFYVLFRYFNINLMTSAQKIRSLVSGTRLPDIAILAGIGIAVYLFASPFLCEVFSEPISAIQDATDSIRRTAIVFVFMMWLLAIGFLSKRSSSGYSSANPPAYQGGFQIPPPPVP